jgi:hypothetical protein
MEPDDQEIDTRICTFAAENGDEVIIDEYQECVSAYYFRNNEMTGGVWLFNVGKPSGKTFDHPPYPPELEFVVPHLIEGAMVESDFQATFHEEDEVAVIYYKTKPVGVLWNGAHPGQSAYAAKDFGGAMKMDFGE